MNKYEFKLNGETIKWEEKSHAQIFRNFWAYFTEMDVNKTLETIETAGLRTSDQPEFIAKNGSRKKHVHIKDNVWIYSHLTPKAMQNTYDKFLKFWSTEQQEQPTAQDTPEETPETSPVTPSDEVEIELTPQQKAALTRKRNKEAKQREAELKAQQEAQEETPDVQQLTTEDLAEVEI